MLLTSLAAKRSSRLTSGTKTTLRVATISLKMVACAPAMRLMTRSMVSSKLRAPKTRQCPSLS